MLLAAETGIASVVIPTELYVVHPPDLASNTGNGAVNANLCKVLENVVEGDWDKCAVGETWTGWGRELLGSGHYRGLGCELISSSGDSPVAVGACRVASQ